MTNIGLLLVLLVFTGPSLFAQKLQETNKYWALGGEIHQNYFNGDLYSSIHNGRPGLGFVVLRKYTPRTTLKASIKNDFLFASKHKSLSNNNTRFKATLTELEIGIRMFYFENRQNIKKRVNVNFFIEPGISGQYIYSKKSMYDNLTWNRNNNQLVPALKFGIGTTFKRTDYSAYLFRSIN